MYPSSAAMSVLPAALGQDGLDCVHDGFVPGAAAVIAGKVLANLRARCERSLLHEVARSDEHAGRAKTTLQRVPAEESLLQLRERPGIRKPLDRVDSPAVRL